ncbi:MAG TPA: aldose 1-epimerase [Thermoanaerobaculia bacterium]|nr:aldose 1-epimerase [Thermoanaerobaculia bacterium]
MNETATTPGETIEIGGLPVVTLERAQLADPERPVFTRAQILPGRGMMTLQIQVDLPGHGAFDLLTAPPLAEARELLRPEAEPFPGNHSYMIGGALLLPYANRIRGRLSDDGRTIETEVAGRTVLLPANAGGRRPGAEQYAMHGLLLDAPVTEQERETTAEADVLRGTLQAGDFGGRWPSRTEIRWENVLRSDSFTFGVIAVNVGDEILPMGIGWHPYFNLPSGRREQARLHIPARRRTPVNDYDEVLPTGEVVPLAGTPYDFSMPGGREVGDLYLDDCFVDLARSGKGEATAEIVDPAGGLGLRILAASPRIQAFQVYAPPEKSFLVVEPQFNWADPFGSQWPAGTDTGMALLKPGEAALYEARLELFRPE